jgi:tripartite ATP-independent transporter DctP family solute receptor
VTLNRRTFCAAIAGTIAAPAVIGRASAATPLVVASLLGEDKPETRLWAYIRDRVEQELPGAFTFNIVPNAALGGEKEVVEGMQLGSIQASLSTLSNLSAWVPESQLFDMPFLFRDAAHLYRALDGKDGGELRNQLGKQGLTTPAFINYGARHLLAREPLIRPASLRGKRIRVIQSPLHAQLWESFGALPIALPITETYNALATGHVDAMDLTISAYAGFRLYEVVPHVIETGHIHAAGGVIFSGSFWSRLTAEQQAVLEGATIDGARYFDALMVADERASVEVAKSGGAVFHPISDRGEWEKPARTVWESFADRVGGMDRILAVAALDE